MPRPFHCRMHRTASRSVQHPGRDLLNLHDRRFRQAAPHHRAAAPFDHPVQEDGSPEPRMPFIANPNLATASDTMGLVEGSCTTAAGRIRALTGRRRTRPISTGCRTLRRPEPGRPPLKVATDAVQTNRATSCLGPTGPSLRRVGEAGRAGHLLPAVDPFITAPSFSRAERSAPLPSSKLSRFEAPCVFSASMTWRGSRD